MWKIISTKTIFKHPRIELLEDLIQLPDGTETRYLKYKKKNDCVTIIAEREDGTVLLQKEYSHPIGEVIWQLPGGSMNPNESPEQGADRELQEEGKVRGVGYKTIGRYLMNNRRSENWMNVVVAIDTSGSVGLKADAEEVIESFWKTPHEIDEMIQANEIINCHTLASWSIYRMK